MKKKKKKKKNPNTLYWLYIKGIDFTLVQDLGV